MSYKADNARTRFIYGINEKKLDTQPTLTDGSSRAAAHDSGGRGKALDDARGFTTDLAKREAKKRPGKKRNREISTYGSCTRI